MVEVQKDMVRALLRYIDISPISQYSCRQPMFRGEAVGSLRDALWTEIKITFKAEITMVAAILRQHSTCIAIRAKVSDLGSINVQKIGYPGCPVPYLAGIWKCLNQAAR